MMLDAQKGQFLTAYVNDHYLGIPIGSIQDVIGPQPITKIPLSRNAVAGVLNLRGRIVTAIDMHERLEEPQEDPGKTMMGVIIENQDELFSLLVDHVEDVMTIEFDDIEKCPPTLNPLWQGVCTGVYQLKGKIMILLDVPRILDLEQPRVAA
jgi:purine-binding chemotaxis protein CheW